MRALRLVRDGRRDGETTLAPYHDRIREVTLRCAGGELPRRHADIAEALLARGAADPEILSRHLHAAEQHERALPYTLDAAAAARSALAF